MPSGGPSACCGEEPARSGEEAGRPRSHEEEHVGTGHTAQRLGPQAGTARVLRPPPRGPHLPERQDQQGQQQEAPQGAAHDDPDGDLRVFLLGDLKRDLQGERWGCINSTAVLGPQASGSLGQEAGQGTAGCWWESCIPLPWRRLQNWVARAC